MEWIKEEFFRGLRVGLTNLKITSIMSVVFLIIFFLSYFYFSDSLAENGFWVIFIPMMSCLIISILYLYPKRNNPDYKVYYLFHLSPFSIVLLVIGIFAWLALLYYISCRGDLMFQLPIKACFNIERPYYGPHELQ